jgi:hypothetical protein
VIVLETPNTACAEFRLLRRRHWGGYHAPRHWHLFSPSAFEALCGRLGCRIVHSEQRFIPNYWNWTLHSWSLDRVGRRAADLLFPPVKVDYGGVQALVLLGGFAVLGRLLQRLTGEGNALLLMIQKGPAGATP